MGSRTRLRATCLERSQRPGLICRGPLATRRSLATIIRGSCTLGELRRHPDDQAGVALPYCDSEEIGMGNPQFDRLKTAPLQALRAMFAGIGRILLSADRPQNQARRAYERASGDNGQSRSQPTTSIPEASSRWRSLDTTGNVRLLPPRTRDENGPGTSERTAAPAPQPEPGDEPTPEPAAEAEPAEEPVAEAAPASAAEPITEPIPAVPVPAAEAASPELPLAS